jgi:hypothetical protein
MSVEDRVRRALTEYAGDESPVPDVDALTARGLQARRRRRLILASVVATVLIGAVAVAGPMITRTTGPAPVVGTPAPSSSAGPTSSATPQQGSGFFAGSANAPVSFTVPVGWETLDAFFVLRSGADPAFGVAFYDVANLYADGCRWVQVDPPVGPSVDDLVEAYGEIPELRAGSARAITVDGFEGQELRFSVPDFDEATCKDGTYALVQADNAGSNTARPGAPNLWALTPGQQNQAWILDVDGTRLVVFAVHPATISAQDQADIDTILGSLQIG